MLAPFVYFNVMPEQDRIVTRTMKHGGGDWVAQTVVMGVLLVRLVLVSSPDRTLARLHDNLG